MRIYEEGGRQREFPFRTLRLVGWALLILGIIVLILGVVDVGWTAGNYAGNTCNTDNWQPPNAPCTVNGGTRKNNENLVWTWVAAPIWASFFVIITGIIGTRFSTWNTESLRFQRDLFTVMCVLVCLLWGPAIIVLASLEIWFGMDIFYYNQNDQLQVQDTAKLVVPIMVAIITFFLWIAAIIGVCIGCCCAPVVDDDYGFGRSSRSSRDCYSDIRPYRRERVYGSVRKSRYSRDRDTDIVPYRREKVYDSFPRRSRSHRTHRSAPVVSRGNGEPIIGPPVFLGGQQPRMQPQIQAQPQAMGYPYPSQYATYATSPMGYYGGAYGGANYGSANYGSYSPYGVSAGGGGADVYGTYGGLGGVGAYGGYGGYGAYGGRAASASPYF